MQFTEVLTRDEKAHLSRFVTSFEQEYALSDEFQVVSLARTLELGGFTHKHRDAVAPKQKATPDPMQTASNSLEARESNDLIVIRDMYLSRMLSRAYSADEEDKGLPAADWNVPKLALAPVSFKKEVALTSEGKDYKLTAGKWTTTFRPPWHTAFPTRGTAGWNQYAMSYSSQLPPLPREAQKAVADFGAGKCVVLWEADWEKREQYLDPAILVPVWRDLYSVVYTWDLTEAERAALKKASANP